MTTATDFSDLSPKWRERFAFFEQYGPIGSPEGQAAFKASSFRKRLRINMNGWAFFFGIVYLPMLGLWRRWLALMVATIIVIPVVLVLMTEVGSAGGWVGAAVGVFYALIASCTNYAYYLKRTTGKDSYNLFIGRSRSDVRAQPEAGLAKRRDLIVDQFSSEVQPGSGRMKRRHVIVGGGLLALVGGVGYGGWWLWRRVSSGVVIGGNIRLMRNPDGHDGVSLERQRQLALGAVLGEMNHAYLDTLTTGMPGAAWRETLSSFWDINDHHSAMATFKDLLSPRGGHRTVFKAVAQAVATNNKSALNKLTDDPDWRSRLYRYYDNVSSGRTMWSGQLGFDTDGAAFGRLDFTAWDAGRLAAITRMAFDAGYISEAEAWSTLADAERLARIAYKSWKDFGIAYAFGRAMWGGPTKDTVEVIEICRYLTQRLDSPWVLIPWS